MEALSDGELAAKTAEFKRLLSSGKDLDALLLEAFAVVREASKRVLNMRHYDVQLVRRTYFQWHNYALLPPIPHCNDWSNFHPTS